MQHHQLLWAKTGPNNTSHPLLAHLIDVGAAAAAIVPALSGRIPRIGEVSPNTLSFLAACHDLGKCTPAFQAKRTSAVAPLKAVGFPFPALSSTGFPHALATALTLGDLLAELGMDASAAKDVAWALGGHHGLWPTATEAIGLARPQLGSGLWVEARRWLVQTLADLFKPNLASVPHDNVWLALFSGVVAVADWLGSDKDRFPIADCASPDAYFAQAQVKAQRDLPDLQAWPGIDRDFVSTFGFVPNAVQNAVDASNPPAPWCVIVEAATGSGKTEAALWAGRTSPGLYIAMPTMATADAMLPRVERFSGEKVRLAHGQARWLQPSDWFTPAKQTLMAPLGVGTVDQALLGVLNAPHWFVRLLGMAGRTVVFDEVHAYDVYMSDVHTRLLEWLRAVNANVVILSATLPSAARERIIAAYGDHTASVQVKGKSRTVELRHTEDIGATALAHQGTVGIVVNSVSQCQEIAAALQPHLQPHELLVLHSRMTHSRRRAAESRLLASVGKNTERPARLIVVATQVIEQSLDIDLDLLITTWAPVDSLIQRIGRLHRHTKRGTPVCYVAPGGPYDNRIYEPYLLLRTQSTLAQRTELHLPADTQALLAHVYDEPDDLVDEELAAWEKMQERNSKMSKAAELRLVPGPTDSSLLRRQGLPLSEEGGHMLAAVTRMGRPSVRIVTAGAVDDDWRALNEVVAPLTHGGVVRCLLDNGRPTWDTGPMAGHYQLLLPAQVGDYHLTDDPVLGIVIERMDTNISAHPETEYDG